jgi:O-antigen/teichoic acid export membrane protein
MVASVSDQLAMRFDNLIMSRLFDPGVMARYNLAYSLAEMPVNSIAMQIGDVLMPAFSKMEDEARRGAVIQAAALMSFIVAPLGVGLAAVAPTLAATFFDDKWGPAMASMLSILSIMAVFRPMTWSAIAYLQAVQQTRYVLYSSLIRVVIVLSLITLGGVYGGVDWACAGATLGFAIHAVVTIVGAGRAVGFSVGAYLLGVARPILPCIPMYFAVFGAERLLSAASIPLPLSLAAQVVVGAIVYIGAAFVLLRKTVTELLRQGREALRRRRG